MADTDILNTFIKIEPYPGKVELPEIPGVFVILAIGDTDNEITKYLYCGEATNIRHEAKKVINSEKYNDFPRALTYLVKEEPSIDSRLALIEQLKQCFNLTGC